MKYVLLFFVIIGCGTTNVKKLKNLKSLPDDTPVTIFTEKHPPLFDYEEICEIIISKQGNSATGKVKAYEDELKAEARKCGTPFLYVGHARRVTQRGTGVLLLPGSLLPVPYPTENKYSYGGGVAIQPTSEELKLTNEKINRLLKAMKTGNVGTVKIILSDLNPDPTKRFSYDNRVLEALILIEGEKGSLCNKKVIQVFKEFNPVLTRIYREGLKEKLHDLLYCESLVYDQYDNFKNRTGLVDYVLSKAGRASKPNLKKIKKVLSKVGDEIQRSCQSDLTSEICSMKKPFKKLRAD